MRETLYKDVFEPNYDEAIQYLENRTDQITDELKERADRVILVRQPPISGEEIKFRFLEEDSRVPFEIIEIEEPENYKELLDD